MWKVFEFMVVVREALRRDNAVFARTEKWIPKWWDFSSPKNYVQTPGYAFEAKLVLFCLQFLFYSLIATAIGIIVSPMKIPMFPNGLFWVGAVFSSVFFLIGTVFFITWCLHSPNLKKLIKEHFSLEK